MSWPYHRGQTLIHLDKRARTRSSFMSASCTQRVLECTPTCQTQHVPLSQLAAAGARTHNSASLSGLTSLWFLPDISCKHTRQKRSNECETEMCVRSGQQEVNLTLMGVCFKVCKLPKEKAPVRRETARQPDGRTDRQTASQPAGRTDR